ncbi:XRE family transcriptional regulator, partial [Corallococcus sp. AB049A]
MVKTHPRGPLASGRVRKKPRVAPASAAALSRRQLERKLAVSVGAAARAARLKAGLTQADVADRVGIASEVYGRLERGKMMPSVPTLFRL